MMPQFRHDFRQTMTITHISIGHELGQPRNLHALGTRFSVVTSNQSEGKISLKTPTVMVTRFAAASVSAMMALRRACIKTSYLLFVCVDSRS